MKSKILFIIIASLEILAQFETLPLQFLHQFTKPLLMPALALFFYFETKSTPNIRKNWMYLALFFAWLGDIFLMHTQRGPNYFIFGLASFLLMQINYIYLFKPLNINILYTKKLQTLIIFTIGLSVLFTILPNAGTMKMPVVFYFVAILGMVLSALCLWSKIKNINAQIVYFGAVLFMISDSFIAINKFSFELPTAGFLIMATYILGQWLIVNGMAGLIKNQNI